MVNIVKTLTTPYKLTHWFANLITSLPQLLTGLYLMFNWVPAKFGLPWSNSSLDLFEISKYTSYQIAEFGGIFQVYSDVFAILFIVLQTIIAVNFILGCCIRITSFVFLIQLITILVFREYDGSWNYIPYFIFSAISILGLWFGSSRYGLDYLIAVKLKWCD